MCGLVVDCWNFFVCDVGWFVGVVGVYCFGGDYDLV